MTLIILKHQNQTNYFMNKKLTLIAHLALFAILLISCDSKVDRPAPVLSQDEINRQNQQQAPPVVSGGATASVLHYYCPNNCAGSGGDNAGTCPTCGSEYIHNQAYHDNQTAISTQSAPVPEPAQNASGVWHYTCSNGCAGGAGSAVACSQCGSMLAHNPAYHN